MVEIDGEFYNEDELVECERCGVIIPYESASRSRSGGFLCDICYDDLYA